MLNLKDAEELLWRLILVNWHWKQMSEITSEIGNHDKQTCESC